MNETKISVLIPVYNVENYLRECLDSIIAQTFQDFEVICVDDGSDDKSFEILQEYKNKDKRFSVVRQEHKGVGSARNLALSLAKSKYIQFLDADDFFEPEMFKEMYDTAVKYDTDMVVCTAIKREPDGNIIGEDPISPLNKNIAIFNKPFNWKDCPDKIFKMFVPQPWQVLYKKSLLDKNNLRFPDLTSSNGAALGYIARICASRIVILDRAFINYRVLRPNSITTNMNPVNQLKQLLEAKSFISENNFSVELKQSYENYFMQWLEYKQNEIYGKKYDELIEAMKSLLKDSFPKYKNIMTSRDKAYCHLKEILKNNKIAFWGASLFLEDLIKRYHIENENILGIIDINPNKKGKYIGKYQIYSPQELDKLNPDIILVSIIHHTEERLTEIREYTLKNLKKQIKIYTIL